MIKPTRHYREEFENKLAKVELAYQLDGSSNQARARDKYMDLVDICIEAEKQQDYEDKDKKKRYMNGNAVLKKFEEIKEADKKYTAEEVVEWMEKMQRVML